MSNPINNKVPSLSAQASSCVLNHLEESIPGKGDQDLDLWGMEREEACKAGLMQVWEGLLSHPDQHSYLKLTMEKIQDLVIKGTLFEKFKCACVIFGPLEVDSRNAIPLIQKSLVEACISDKTISEVLLRENVVQAFRKLANAFGLASISTDFNVYKSRCDEQEAQDKALELVWSHSPGGIAGTLGIDAPRLTTASEIRAWMADPKNAQVLEQITQISFVGCYLKVIPVEILTLPGLTKLCLVRCGIRVIPEELAISQLKHLDLRWNVVKVIPEAFTKSQLEHLNLSGNQIRVLPEAFKKSQKPSMKVFI
jgi:Leucine-rich repeat (LRR) protein